MSKLRPREVLAGAYIDRTQTAELHRAGLPCSSLNQQRTPAGCQGLAVESDADLSSVPWQKPEKSWYSKENPIPP